MTDKILCPNCHKTNDIQRYCIYCGCELMDEDKINLIQENPEPYCLNCGRTVSKDQKICECGYEFEDVNCPDCNAKNPYANRFCTSCGKKLWTNDVYYYKYPERLFEEHLFNEHLPPILRNTSLFNRTKNRNVKKDSLTLSNSLNGLESGAKKADKNLSEICSRWKIVSPNYCINCLAIVKPDEHTCQKCGSLYCADRKRIESIRSINSYVKPQFDSVELKWTPKYKSHYLGSLAPAIGESQFEYRERLKWEFSQNNYLKKIIMNAIERKKFEEKRKREFEERKKQREEYIRQHGGGYCSLSCRHCYEEFFDGGGAIVGDFTSEGYTEYYCHLGHSVQLGNYCQDYE